MILSLGGRGVGGNKIVLKLVFFSLLPSPLSFASAQCISMSPGKKGEQETKKRSASSAGNNACGLASHEGIKCINY